MTVSKDSSPAKGSAKRSALKRWKTSVSRPPKIYLWEDPKLKDHVCYLIAPHRLFWLNFLAGTARGLGFLVGTVVVIALLSFILGRVLSQIPWVGELFVWLQEWLKANLDSYPASTTP